jgi:5-methylcytosine-specific restriction endonuclease McrA
MKEYPLEFELVPKPAWRNNLRKILSQDDWRAISKFVRSEHKCDICGRHLPAYQLDAHEKWSYNDDTCTQKLEDILSLCKDCHRVKHIGRAQVVGEEDLAREWFMKVNQCSLEDYRDALEEAATIWRKRSRHGWQLDISLIDNWKDKI